MHTIFSRINCRISAEIVVGEMAGAAG